MSILKCDKACALGWQVIKKLQGKSDNLAIECIFCFNRTMFKEPFNPKSHHNWYCPVITYKFESDQILERINLTNVENRANEIRKMLSLLQSSTSK